MRLALAVLFASSALAQPGLEREDIRDIQRVLKAKDSSLDRFEVRAKKPLRAAAWSGSVMLVTAAPTELRPGARVPSPIVGATQVAVFLVEGPANQVRKIVDIFPLRDVVGDPTLDAPSANAVYLHFHSDYGFYHGSIKYIYDLSSQAPPAKMRYGMLALTSSQVRDGKLEYTASFGSGGGQTGQLQNGWKERNARITIDPRGAGPVPVEIPGFEIVDAPALDRSYQEPVPLGAANGETVEIVNQAPAGQPHQPSVIYVTDRSGKRQGFPAPLTTMERYRRARPGQQAPLEIESDIGPYVFDGARLWFASTFYDGEGTSGVGAIGLFNVTTRQYDMRYLPEIAPWSGSVARLNGEDLWVGLMRRPEGSDVPGGLLRYNTRTGAVRKFAVADYIYTLDLIDGRLYCGTSNGLYTIRGGAVTQFEFEPDAKGKTILVRRGN